MRPVTARAHGKVNLHLGVGEARADGYHELSTVFMAVDRPETVTLIPEPGAKVASGVVTSMRTTCHVSVPDEDLDTPKNLAWRAVNAICEGADVPSVRIEVDKTIPVAGGMAGGSADAAAAIKAAMGYLAQNGIEVVAEQVQDIAAELGADVPFALMGGIALGTDRGDALVPMMGRGEYWFAFLNPKVGLSTGQVFEHLDDMRFNNASLVPKMDTTLLSRALLSGDPVQVGAVMHNDLEVAALDLQPRLSALIRNAEMAGAIRAMVSGSGPTVAALCPDREAAHIVVDELTRSGDVEGFVAHGSASGATLL
ncbi:4-(cytidine 5'-diphospho)-2-C-methyl-D-erythritol kinase [Corynebacterium sp. MSK044]|uniref:4-(cytidine 5'-diphospho)-2-C-methyl-D-erythritol kinase n=1 Tax=Corynebacterium sp. MSK044 TaxID=3050195 RepID=UPI00254E6EE8|nr:4-(cytidine 5'-diphospho)-2-C-methyl-D-erythritol kinase [Corynebacterium sp. MSK044]MDK8797180.1 4-(cytidine 5'-diphospho)-2-C-methyl-D-erythritol kinase [Corynebacterium sp. MSK044]